MAIDAFRKHVTGWASRILIGLLALSFIAFYATTDISIFKTAKVGSAPAQVNGEKVSMQAFQQQLQQNVARFQSYMQGEVPPQMQTFLVKQTLEQLIQSTLLAQEAKRLGLHVSDLELAKAIMDIPDFQKNGKFDPQMYAQFHQMRNVEEDIRSEILRSKYQQFLGSPFLFSDHDLQQEFEATQNEVALDYLVLNPDTITQKMTLGASALKDFKTKRKADLQSYFDKNPKEFSTDERVRARHILVRIENQNEETSVKKSLEKIQSLRAKALANPKTFGALATEHSDDPGSKANGGDLGFFPRGQMTPLFEEAAFKLKIGEISEPIKTPFGYHIIMVEGKTPAVSKKFVEVENDIALKIFVQENKDTLTRDIAQKINAALKKGQSVQTYLTTYGLVWSKDAKVSAKSQVFGATEGGGLLRAAALRLDSKNPYLEMPLRADGQYYVFKVKSRKSANPKDFEKQKPMLEGQLTYQYTTALQQNVSKYLQERAKIVRNELFETALPETEG